MENLDKLTAAGLPIFDLNLEYLERTDWSQTPLGPRDSWPLALRSLVFSCILPIPHCTAIFWGNDLAIIHNLAWGKVTRNFGGQGARAHDSYSGEALSALNAAVRGRTVKVACKFFLRDTPECGADSVILLSTILDDNGVRQGAYAQILHSPTVERYLPMAGLDKMHREHPARQTKQEGAQQTHGEPQADSKQTKLFSLFAELVPNGLAILDSGAEAVFVNDGFFKLTTNRSSKEFRAWPESIDPRDYEWVMDAYRRAFSSRQELRVEFRCTGNSSIDDEEWRLFLLKPLNEDPEAGFICAVVDITEIKRAQITQERTAIEAQERKEQQERFIDMVSHEIRNPLSAVLHLAEEVKDIARDIRANRDDVSDKVADILDAADTILLCVSHQNVLVDDILSFSKLDSMMLTLVPREIRPKWDFSKALKVFHSEFKAKNIKFHYAMDVSYDGYKVDHVVADLNRMQQVLVNLITNAIKFTAKKDGERNITVSMGASIERPSSYPPNVIFFSEDENVFRIDSTMTAEWGYGPTFYLMIAVKDTGIGISAEGQAKLFERFRQATPKTQEKYGGSGLGLFISRKLCQLHGGDIGVSSKEGEGSTFGFFFKVRRSNGTRESGRPPFGSRTSSEASNMPMQSPRPSYSRSNSVLVGIKESPNERPKLRNMATLSSHRGIDTDEVDNSLKDPPTEYRGEAHPQASEAERYRENQPIAENIKTKGSSTTSAIENKLPDLEEGETKRQARGAEIIGRIQNNHSSDSHPVLLLVEDNLINQKVLRRQLQFRGFEVFVANNGQEAINAVETRGKAVSDKETAHNYFDCILMDQEMPIKDGNTATIEIRELQEKANAGRSLILGVSANVREGQMKSMMDAGMDAIISKPFKVDDLVAKIRKLLPAG
ncbi:two component histidine kinase 1 [Lindgomyces ingoldianus]|uniref:Two component histidine kinase 1 n=1 Tax=Lindgomyces ingoldianus TaxID=673940 RepID=A0ACB6R4K6_9PLEO|nr:two component histidine kinase 1 [Lindgomyces ingoldianus]KAF2474121.1 two component histidine kinase 1 [Lindgomyces ingoldianus]